MLRMCIGDQSDRMLALQRDERAGFTECQYRRDTQTCGWGQLRCHKCDNIRVGYVVFGEFQIFGDGEGQLYYSQICKGTPGMA